MLGLSVASCTRFLFDFYSLSRFSLSPFSACPGAGVGSFGSPNPGSVSVW